MIDLYRPLRRCGCGSLRFFENMSAGNSASKSRTRTIPPAFSRKTISSPRRKISTSELLTLNFFGSLTAWLLPDLNTRAMAMIRLLDIYTRMYIHMQAQNYGQRQFDGSPESRPDVNHPLSPALRSRAQA